MKKTLSLLIVFTLLASLFSCAMLNPLNAKDKTFSKEGMNVTLTSGFTEAEYPGMTVCYDSAKVAVFALKEPISSIPNSSDYTASKYASLLRDVNKDKSPSSLKKIENIPCFDYTFLNEEENVEYYYLTAAYKSDDAFWMIQFCCRTTDKEECEPYLEKFAKSVTFD